VLVASLRVAEGDAAAEREQRAASASRVVRAVGRLSNGCLSRAGFGDRRGRHDRAGPSERPGQLQFQERTDAGSPEYTLQHAAVLVGLRTRARIAGDTEAVGRAKANPESLLRSSSCAGRSEE